MEDPPECLLVIRYGTESQEEVNLEGADGSPIQKPVIGVDKIGLAAENNAWTWKFYSYGGY